MSYALECHHLHKSYNDTVAAQDVSLAIEAGEFVTLLGPSGCGKTTTLRLIAGFETPDSGAIKMNGRDVFNQRINVPVEERRIGMVFQEYALFPHLNVADNIGFGLHNQKNGKHQRVDAMLEVVGLGELHKRMPHELSGGQQQRIALARALAPQPDILLLDEPFSNLDAALRAQVRAEVRSIIKGAGITTIFVTHDQQEALSLSDKVAVMFDGYIAQIASPHTLYTHPTSREVAAFIGEANFLRGEANGDSATCVLGNISLSETQHGGVELLLRPEALQLDTERNHNASVSWVEFYGHDQRIGVQLDDGTPLIIRADTRHIYAIGQRVAVVVETSVRAFSRL